jgi:hypothetical protein
VSDAAVSCDACGQPATGEHTYHDRVICADCAIRSAEYERRRETHVERLEARADRTRQDANATAQRATEMASRIPFGQPMMPDHHSYGRDRRYRERIDRLYGQAHRTWQDADRQQRRAEAAAANTAVSSDDPLAVLKLEEQLAAAERSQTRMKQANAIIRKWLAGAPDTCRSELAALGLSETVVEAILHPRFESKPGFPSYALSNNNATIRRLKERIAELRARREQVVADADGENAPVEIRPGLTVVRNVEANRLQLVFDEKPVESVRAILKAHGWRWARSQGAWQRHLNAGSEYALERTLKALEEHDAAD